MTAPIGLFRNSSPALLRVSRCTAATLLLAAVLIGGAKSDAAAQSLDDRVKRMQQELQTLQRHVYGGSSGSSSGGAAVEAGKPQMARMELRLKQMENEMRALTGQLEEVSFRINQVGQRLDSLVADVDRRLLALEQGGAQPLGDPLAGTTGGQAAQLGQDSATQGSLGTAGQGAASQGAASQGTANQGIAGQTGQGFDTGPQVLGTVRASDLDALRQQQAQGGTTGQATSEAGAAATGQQTAALAGETPKEQYDYAFGLLSQANYPEAERALTAFLDSYPADPLAGNAKYWLGETFYVRGQFREAAVTFAEGFQRYPDSPKAPDNLLKLGKSLAALGQSADACGTFAELVTRYPNAPATIHQQAATEQQRLSCQ